MYWYITYSWRSGSNRIYANTLHHGSMFLWIRDVMLQQPEDWKLHNQVELTRDQYDALKEDIF